MKERGGGKRGGEGKKHETAQTGRPSDPDALRPSYVYETKEGKEQRKKREGEEGEEKEGGGLLSGLVDRRPSSVAATERERVCDVLRACGIKGGEEGGGKKEKRRKGRKERKGGGDILRIPFLAQIRLRGEGDREGGERGGKKREKKGARHGVRGRLSVDLCVRAPWREGREGGGERRKRGVWWRIFEAMSDDPDFRISDRRGKEEGKKKEGGKKKEEGGRSTKITWPFAAFGAPCGSRKEEKRRKKKEREKEGGEERAQPSPPTWSLSVIPTTKG